MSSDFDNLERAVERLAEGGMVIVFDDAREQEGDFLAAAESITASQIHFMTTYGRGHLCLPVRPAIASRLDLQLLVPGGGIEAPRFAMPIDHRDCQTGISPVDRELTIRRIVNEESHPEEFNRPGHVFPLIAEAGGILRRTGHTEATIEFLQLAGLVPVGVLCEICSGDGRNMAGAEELAALAVQFDIPMVSIESLIEYRREHASEIELLDLACEVSQCAAPDNRSAAHLQTQDQTVKGHDVPVVGPSKETTKRAAGNS